MDWIQVISLGVTVIGVIGAPVIGFVIGGIKTENRDIWTALNKVRDDLAAYKVEVAKTYVAASTLDAMEKRIMDHLNRIETKLDKHRTEEKD